MKHGLNVNESLLILYFVYENRWDMRRRWQVYGKRMQTKQADMHKVEIKTGSMFLLIMLSYERKDSRTKKQYSNH